MYQSTCLARKRHLILALLCLCSAPSFLFPGSCPAAEERRKLIDLIPYDAVAYLSISDLDAMADAVVNLPEWEELYAIDEVQEALAQPEQLLTMLLGLTAQELIGFLGHSLALGFLGIEAGLPVACLAIDAGENGEQAQYAVEQLIALTALSGEMTPRDDVYRDLPYTGISFGEIELRPTFPRLKTHLSLGFLRL